jgi:chemotaxis response regulator CheB
MKNIPKTRDTRRTNAARREFSARKGDDAFPIVGIGASAGEPEALEKFLSHVNLIDGLVITLADITEAKTLEAELRRALVKTKEVNHEEHG